MSDTLCPTDPSTLRAELARANVKLYKLAALVGRHPARLSTMLNADTPFPENLGKKILNALKTKEALVRS